jgi:hypothetical protein
MAAGARIAGGAGKIGAQFLQIGLASGIHGHAHDGFGRDIEERSAALLIFRERWQDNLIGLVVLRIAGRPGRAQLQIFPYAVQNSSRLHLEQLQFQKLHGLGRTGKQAGCQDLACQRIAVLGLSNSGKC